MIRLLRRARAEGASDLHLTVGAAPFLRLHGELVLMDEPPLAKERCREMVLGVLTDDQRRALEGERALCCSLTDEEGGYYRLNVYHHRGAVEAAVRIGLSEIPDLDALGLPPVVADLARRPSGLVLITGATGQGKTTTFNAIVHHVNRERRCKIVTVEDPVEHVHRNIRSIVIQQEVHVDVRSFHEAIVHVLRQDPDIIGVGEMRDLETISAAITAAETGHLVVATLHTRDCSQTVSRVIDVFPPHQQEQVRVQLAGSLVAVLNQRLLPRVDRKGRVLACEVLVATDAVRNLIRENKLQQIDNLIWMGKIHKMQLMDEVLVRLYREGRITYDAMVSASKDSKRIEPLRRDLAQHATGAAA